jgi:hypothetical protein
LGFGSAVGIDTAVFVVTEVFSLSGSPVSRFWDRFWIAVAIGNCVVKTQIHQIFAMTFFNNFIKIQFTASHSSTHL